MSVPPPAAPPRRRPAWWLLLFPAGALALLGWNLALERACPVWVVNHAPQDALLLRGGERLALIPTGAVQAVALGEGRHTLRLEQRDGAEEVEVELRRGFWERFRDRGPFVLNVARLAALRWEEAVYAGGDDVAPPRPARLFVGDSFLRVEDVDYAFTPLPEVLEGHDPGGERVTSLQALHGGILQAMGGFPRHTPAGVKLRYLELRLPFEAEDPDALEYYLLLCEEEGQSARAREFLHAGLSRRPPLVSWHRAWQDLARQAGEEEQARAESTARAEAEPALAALQYLAGRVEPDPAAAEARYARALELEPELGWAWHGQAFLRAARGDLAGACSASLTAVRALPLQPEVEALARQLRLLAGQAAEVRAELLEQERAGRLGSAGLRSLLEACVAAGDLEGARAACGRFAGLRAGSSDPASRRKALLAELTLQELEGRWDELLAALPGLDRPATAARLRAAALLETGRLEEAEQVIGEEVLRDGAREALLLSLAWSLAGDAGRAARWREAAAERWGRGPARERLAARALRAADPLPELARVALPVADQAALLLALASAHPGPRAELLRRATPLVAHGELFPARLLRRAQRALGG